MTIYYLTICSDYNMKGKKASLLYLHINVNDAIEPWKNFVTRIFQILTLLLSLQSAFPLISHNTLLIITNRW